MRSRFAPSRAWMLSPAAWSVLLQGAGSAANVVASIVVAAGLGLAAQGEFALLRSWTDAATALLMLGLPQGMLHLAYRDGVAVRSLRPTVWRATAVTGGVAALVLLASVAGLTERLPGTPTQHAVIALAVPLFVAHRLWRSLVLRLRGVVMHAWLSALPSLLILLGVAGLAAAGRARGFEWVLLGAALATAAFGLVITIERGSTAMAEPLSTSARRTLWSVSAQTWAQGLLSALLPAALLSVAGLMGASLAEVGVLSLGLQVYQLFAVAATYAAPVLYDRVAAATPDAATADLVRGWRRRVGWPGALLALAAALAGPWLLARAWPPAAGYEVAMTVMALAGLAALVVRLWWTLLQAQGRIAALTWQAGWRLLAAVALSVWGLQHWTAPVAVPLALLLVEVATLVQLHLTRPTHRGAA